jgi:hypothetical protein
MLPGPVLVIVVLIFILLVAIQDRSSHVIHTQWKTRA